MILWPLKTERKRTGSAVYLYDIQIEFASKQREDLAKRVRVGWVRDEYNTDTHTHIPSLKSKCIGCN